MFEKIKAYYDNGLWTKIMVNKVVAKGTITPVQYQEITLEPYIEVIGEATDSERIKVVEEAVNMLIEMSMM